MRWKEKKTRCPHCSLEPLAQSASMAHSTYCTRFGLEPSHRAKNSRIIAKHACIALLSTARSDAASLGAQTPQQWRRAANLTLPTPRRQCFQPSGLYRRMRTLRQHEPPAVRHQRNSLSLSLRAPWPRRTKQRAERQTWQGKTPDRSATGKTEGAPCALLTFALVLVILVTAVAVVVLVAATAAVLPFPGPQGRHDAGGTVPPGVHHRLQQHFRRLEPDPAADGVRDDRPRLVVQANSFKLDGWGRRAAA